MLYWEKPEHLQKFVTSSILNKEYLAKTAHFGWTL
jgi:hypothetical protein